MGEPGLSRHKSHGMEGSRHPQADLALEQFLPLLCPSDPPSPQFHRRERGQFAHQGVQPGRATLSPGICWGWRRRQRGCLLPAPLRSTPCCHLLS